jgi:hypothetical protein
VIWMVSLPSAAPFIATRVRLASSIAIILDVGIGIVTGPVDGPGIGGLKGAAYGHPAHPPGRDRP